MNVYSHIVLEVVRNNFSYRFEIPFGASYVDSEEVAKQMVEQVKEMARVASEKAAKAPQEAKSEEAV